MFQLTYNVKCTIFLKPQNRTKDLVIIKDWSCDLPDNLLYNNTHIVESGHIFSIMGAVLTDYLNDQGLTENDIEVESYEIVSSTEGTQVYFVNPDGNTFTLSPEIRVFIEAPVKEFVAPSDFNGKLVDENAIIWSWSNKEYQDCGFYILDQDSNIIAQLPQGSDNYLESYLKYNTIYTRQLVAYNATDVSTPSNKLSITTKEQGTIRKIQNAIADYDEKYYATKLNPVEDKFCAFSSGIGIKNSGTNNHLFIDKDKDNEFFDEFTLVTSLVTDATVQSYVYKEVKFRYQFMIFADVPEYHKQGSIVFKVTAYRKGYVEWLREALVYVPLTVKWLGYVDIEYPEADDSYTNALNAYYRNIYS